MNCLNYIKGNTVIQGSLLGETCSRVEYKVSYTFESTQSFCPVGIHSYCQKGEELLKDLPL